MNNIYELVRQIWEEERIPEEWKEPIIVPTYQKGELLELQGNSIRKCSLQNFGKYNYGKN